RDPGGSGASGEGNIATNVPTLAQANREHGPRRLETRVEEFDYFARHSRSATVPLRPTVPPDRRHGRRRWPGCRRSIGLHGAVLVIVRRQVEKIQSLARSVRLAAKRITVLPFPLVLRIVHEVSRGFPSILFGLHEIGIQVHVRLIVIVQFDQDIHGLSPFCFAHTTTSANTMNRAAITTMPPITRHVLS